MSYTEDTESYPIEQTSAEFLKNLKKKNTVYFTLYKWHI